MTVNKNVFYIESIPPKAEEYLILRKKAGLSSRQLIASQDGLKNSIYAISVRENETHRLIGMGRIIGDGGTVYQLVDIAVDPNYQGLKIGTQIMEHLMLFVNESINQQAYVNLIADIPADRLYEKFGFVKTEPE
ncbi:GNAT family N-acetyltransferase [Vagococcus carniphilus]|nr:GNAT family N-acetyltransferase [Vagococcus carniphilus]MDT2865453.1 GNAT family N-acetyltransferase [Vagococcus carniphilus]